MTCFHASFDVKRCQFTLPMFSFMFVVWGSKFLLWTFTVITQWSLPKGLSVIFQDMMGCREGSFDDFEVPDLLCVFRRLKCLVDFC